VEPGPPRTNPWLVTAAVLLPTIMEVLDTSIVNVALPHMAGSLGADVSESTWVLTSYLVSNAIVLPMTFWLSKLFGRRAYLLGCIALFTTASVLCATADTLAGMVVYRVLQGAAGGALQPLSQAILLESFPEEERGPAMAVWGVGIIVAPIVAPLLGGYFVESLSWHWIFLINAPIGVIAFLAVSALVVDPPHARRDPLPADVLGISLLVVGMASAQVVLDKGQEWGWWGSHPVRILATLAVGCLGGLILYERRRRDGVIDLSVFRDRTFSLGTANMFLFGFAVYGTLALIPLFTQTLLDYSALQAGIVLSPRGLSVMAAMSVAGLLLRRTDPRWVMLCGAPFLVASGVLMARFTLETGAWTIVRAMVVQGIGLGFIFVPLATATMSNTPNERMSNATGIFNLMRNIGGSIGVSVTQTVIAQAQQVHHNQLAKFVSPYDPVFVARWRALIARFSAAGMGPAHARREALAAIARGIEAQAAMLSYRNAFLLLAVLFVLMVPLILGMRPRRGAEVGLHEVAL
jgi:DHA2 family multidrug resistance protein